MKQTLQNTIHSKRKKKELGRFWDSWLYRFHPHSSSFPFDREFPISHADFGKLTKERVIAALSLATRSPKSDIVLVSRSNPGLPEWWSNDAREHYMTHRFWRDLTKKADHPAYTFWGALARAHDEGLKKRLKDKFNRLESLVDECILDEARPVLKERLGFVGDDNNLDAIFEEHVMKWQRALLTYWAGYEALDDKRGKEELEPLMRLHPAIFPIDSSGIVLVA